MDDKNLIDKLLDDELDDEVKKQIENLKLDNERLEAKNKSLKKKNERLLNGAAPSILNTYRKSNENLREKNVELNDKLKRLKRKQGSHLAHLNPQQVGVYSRMINDFQGMERNIPMTFPGVDHPIFNRFFELANKYPNRAFIVKGLNDAIQEEKDLINFEIKTQKKNIDIWLKCDELVNKYPDTWKDEVSDIEAYLYQVTTPDELDKKIDKLEKDKLKVDEWFKLSENIQKSPIKNQVEIKNNLYYDIFNEFKRIFAFCKNVGSVTQYKANIKVNGFNKEDMYSALTRELEKQVGLCEEPYTHNFFYSNGEGRLIPYELNKQFQQYINENTTFVKHSKNQTQYKNGDIINSKVLFEQIPLYCNKVQYRNSDLVGFNNCFYNVVTGEIINLNPQIPILPLKNTSTELYLDDGNNEIEMNPMKDIFYQCFTEKDRKALLAYIGCALYDKGYTQRQESLYIMGKGGTGKGLDINEWLPTPNGWTKMKDIKVGDELFDEQGNICTVTLKSQIHNIDCYRITFENGFSLIVDKEHRWLSKTEGEKEHKVRNTEEMYQHMKTINRKRNSFYYAIETNKPLQLNNKDLLIPPYTLGAWLGDGNANDGRIINKKDDNQIIQEIKNDGFKTKRHTYNDDDTRVQIYGLRPKLQEINVLNNKHIPIQYLRGSYEQRLSLLQGIMDTDGSIDKRGSCEIIWASKQMIKELRELLFSLGIKSNINEKQVQLEGWDEPRIYYRLYFKTRLPVFRLKRKKDRIPDYPLRKTQYTRYIKKIEPVDSIPTQCIQVDSPNHLFLATKEFIPTHNSTITRAISSIFYSVGHQLVTKLTDNNEFGFSMFADSDVVVIDEIQAAKKEFADKMKNISGGQALPVEKKHFDTISVPAENVPRVFLIGNNFSKKFYEQSDGAGVKRRILIVIPTKPIQSLGYQWKDLISDSSKQWLVQQATKEYLEQGLHKKAIPIQTISDEEKDDRLEMCTFPERFFIRKHFEVARLDTGGIDNGESIEYNLFHDFIINQIDNCMLEKTIKKGVAQTFIHHVKEALNLSGNYNTSSVHGKIIFPGIVPKTVEAIDFCRNKVI